MQKMLQQAELACKKKNKTHKNNQTTNYLISQESKTEIRICLLSGLMLVSCHRLSHSGTKHAALPLPAPLPLGSSSSAAEGDSALTHRSCRHGSHPAAPEMLLLSSPGPSVRFLSSSAIQTTLGTLGWRQLSPMRPPQSYAPTSSMDTAGLYADVTDLGGTHGDVVTLW